MIRTQIQLTEKQAQALREIAQREQVSMAELIRKSVDALIASSLLVDRESRKKRAVDVAGKFRSGKKDISGKHDEYLAEDLK